MQTTTETTPKVSQTKPVVCVRYDGEAIDELKEKTGASSTSEVIRTALDVYRGYLK